MTATRVAVALALATVACSDGNTDRVHPEISVEPLSLDFGSVTAGATATKDLTLSAGSLATLNVQGLKLGDASFTIAATTLPFDLAAGQQRVLQVTFKAPAATGVLSSTLDITSNADNSPKVTVQLRGETKAGCVDECTDGATRCASLALLQTCGHFDDDSCLEWGDDHACAPAMCVGTACGGCDEGAARRCWVECGQTFAAGCIHGGVEPLIPGVEKCTGGAWGACTTPRTCSGLVDQCTNAQELAITYECLDGSTRTGAYGCTQPLGTNCQASYWTGWGPRHSGAELCSSTKDNCSTEGEKRACVVHCNTPDGATKAGEEQCQKLDNVGPVWGPCLTNDACAP